MKKLGDLIHMPDPSENVGKKPRGGINSLRSHNCGQLLVFMGEDVTLPEEKELERRTPGAGKEAKKKRLNKRIKYWLGRTRKVPADAIYRMMRQARDGKNPQALFNHLLKNYGRIQDQNH